jgi:PTH1 family peptidyl-tRNA hydrolase
MARKLVVGLGNPGFQYRNTPHNLGFEVVEALALEGKLSWNRCAEQGLVAEGQVEGTPLVLMKPQSFMNLSGESVAASLRTRQLPLDDVLVVCDDLALPFGKIRVRAEGGSGGHNGLKSIIASIGSSQFARVRLGIMPASEVPDAAEYVLAPFPTESRPAVEEMVRRGRDAVKVICSHGLIPAMNLFNRSI